MALTTHPVRICVRASLLIGLALLAGCSGRQQPPYAEAYRDALSRYPGTTAVTPAMADRFVAFFSHRGETGDDPAAAPDPAELYGERLYFSDTLVTSEEREVVLAHLRRMRSGTDAIEVQVIDLQVSGQDVYLIWQMRATFSPVSSPVTSNTLGMSHLRFDDAGRIVLQQDFWDSAEGLYRHVPVLGGLIGAVRGRFQP